MVSGQGHRPVQGDAACLQVAVQGEPRIGHEPDPGIGADIQSVHTVGDGGIHQGAFGNDKIGGTRGHIGQERVCHKPQAQVATGRKQQGAGGARLRDYQPFVARYRTAGKRKGERAVGDRRRTEHTPTADNLHRARSSGGTAGNHPGCGRGIGGDGAQVRIGHPTLDSPDGRIPAGEVGSGHESRGGETRAAGTGGTSRGLGVPVTVCDRSVVVADQTADRTDTGNGSRAVAVIDAAVGIVETHESADLPAPRDRPGGVAVHQATVVPADQTAGIVTTVLAYVPRGIAVTDAVVVPPYQSADRQIAGRGTGRVAVADGPVTSPSQPAD